MGEKNESKTKVQSVTTKKVPLKTMLSWPTMTISTSVAAVLLGYVTYYATDILGLSAITVGFVFMLTKIFDGVTDIIAGYIIDKVHLKMGKGRPWQLAIIGYWVSIFLMYSAPKMGITASYIYLFVTYSMINSVFMTLLNCSDPVYLSNSLEDSQQSVSVLAFTGFISLVFTMVASMILPQLVKTMGTTREGWIQMSLVLAVPFTLLSLVRILVIKEKKNVGAVAEKISVKNMFQLLIHNKYILIFALIIFISNIGSSSYATAQTYYYTWIMGDIGLGSIMSLAMLPIIIVIMIMPVLSKKFGFLKVIRVTTLIGMCGYLIRLVDYKSVALLFVSNVVSMMGFYTMFAFAATFVIDCIDYGEWKNGTRSEGTISCAQSVMSKIGAAVGAGVIGVLMGLAGYSGNAAVQTTSANVMIIVLYSVVPAVLCLVQFILLKVYDIDKYLPQIHAELDARHNRVES